MSAEKIITKSQKKLVLDTLEADKDKTTTRVDINKLIARVREEKAQESKTTIMTFGLFAALIIIAGLIFSF